MDKAQQHTYIMLFYDTPVHEYAMQNTRLSVINIVVVRVMDFNECLYRRHMNTPSTLNTVIEICCINNDNKIN